MAHSNTYKRLKGNADCTLVVNQEAVSEFWKLRPQADNEEQRGGAALSCVIRRKGRDGVQIKTVEVSQGVIIMSKKLEAQTA